MLVNMKHIIFLVLELVLDAYRQVENILVKIKVKVGLGFCKGITML